LSIFVHKRFSPVVYQIFQAGPQIHIIKIQELLQPIVEDIVGFNDEGRRKYWILRGIIYNNDMYIYLKSMKKNKLLYPFYAKFNLLNIVSKNKR